MMNYRLVEQVARERQNDLRREALEEQRVRLSSDTEPRLSLLCRLISLFSGGFEPQPAQDVVAPPAQKAPVVSNQLSDCLAC